MKKIFLHIGLQWKLDFRNKSVLLPFYIIPIVFFIVMGFVFSSILPNFEDTLMVAMMVFAVVMATSLGQTAPLCDIYSTDIIKSYKMGNIPLYVPLLVSLISSALHVILVSIIIFVLCPILFKTVFPQQIGQFILGYLSFLFASLGIGTFIGTHVKSTSTLALAGQIVFLPSVMLSGIMFPIELLPSFLQKVAFLFPATLGTKLMSGSDQKIIYYVILWAIFGLLMALSIRKVKQSRY